MNAHHHPTAGPGGNERRALIAMSLTGVVLVVEAVGGWLTGSLALLADAGHMLADFAALALAWTALRVSRRPPDARRSYGYHRFEVLAALINSLALLLIVGWIVVEALGRLAEPTPVLAGPMLAVATVGLAANLASLMILRGGARTSLNLRAAFLHVAGDALGSVAAIVAALVILRTGWSGADPLLSVVVAALVARSAWRLAREAAHVLLEGSPPGFDREALQSGLVGAVPGLLDVHHVHAWSLTPQRPLLTLHARVEPAADPAEVLRRIRARLAADFGIEHATVQVECGSCLDEGPAGEPVRPGELSALEGLEPETRRPGARENST